MAVIVIDPGHGATRLVGSPSPNNATGPAGTKEKTLRIAISLAARTAPTARGHTVFMTHNLGLAARAHVARDHAASLRYSLSPWPKLHVQRRLHQPGGKLANAAAELDLKDSRMRVIAVIDDMGQFLRASFPNKNDRPIPNAWIVIDGEP